MTNFQEFGRQRENFVALVPVLCAILCPVIVIVLTVYFISLKFDCILKLIEKINSNKLELNTVNRHEHSV